MFLFLCLKSSSKKRIQIQTAEHKAVSLRSLPLFRWAVPVSRSSFRSTDHLPPKKRAALKKSSSFFVVCVPSLHTVASCVRRGYCVRNTNPQEKCGSVFASTAPYCLGGCSFAQPSTSIGTPKG